MADNTTTYKAVIDAEVKGQDAVEKLGKTTEETGDSFVKLQLQIRQTQKDLQAAAAAGDKVKFEKLRGQLDDLEEGLEKVQFQAKQFDDQLASLPGPAGAAGNAIKAVDGAFKLLIANPIIAVIGAVIGIFLLFKKSLESTAEGQATLNRISTAFSKILGPILATVEKVALPIFEGFAFVLEKVGQGFAYVAEKMGISKTKIAEASSGITDFKKVNEDAAKSAKELADKQAADAKKKAEDSKKAAEDARKKAEELKQKRIEEAKTAIDLAAKAQTAEQNLANARKQNFTDRILEIKDSQTEADKLYQIEVDRINNLLKVQGLAEKERKQLLIDRTNAEAKYLEDKKAREQQVTEEEKKLAEEKKKTDDENAQKLAEAESIARADKAARIMAEFELQDTLTAQSFQAQLDTFNKVRELERAEMVAKMASADALTAFDAQTAKIRVDIERAASEAKLSVVSNALGTISEAVGASTVAGKALAIAQATIDTYAGATKALATYPPPFGAIAAGTVILAGLLNVKKIVSTKLPTMPGGKGGGGGASAPSIAAPSVSAPQVPQLQSGAGINPTTQIAEGLSKASNKPLKAYVVSTDLSSQQAMDRRTNSAATF